MQYGRFARYTVSYLQQGRATRALRRLPVQQIIAARSERTSSSKADRHVSQRAAAEQPFADNSPWSLRSFRFARRKTFVTHVLQAMTVKEAEKSDILADFHELVNMDVRSFVRLDNDIPHCMINTAVGLSALNPRAALLLRRKS